MCKDIEKPEIIVYTQGESDNTMDQRVGDTDVKK